MPSPSRHATQKRTTRVRHCVAWPLPLPLSPRGRVAEQPFIKEDEMELKAVSRGPFSEAELRALLQVVEDALEWDLEDGELVMLEARLHAMLAAFPSAARGQTT